MNDSTTAFSILAALFCLYVIAVTWQSREVDSRPRREIEQAKGLRHR